MALNGTINGKFGGMATDRGRPYIIWSASQDIANNTSTVTADLYFVRYSGSNTTYDNTSPRFSITIAGNTKNQNVSYSVAPNGSPVRIMSHSRTIQHNSDGRKNISISAGGSAYPTSLGRISVSGGVTLDTIPRATELKSFSIKYSLQIGADNVIDYNVSRKSSSFRHQIELRDGTYVVERWDNVSSSGTSTLTLSGDKVNVMLNRMANSTSKTFTLRVATRSGDNGSWIGSAVTRNSTAHIHTNVTPSAWGMSTNIAGSGRDSDINRYIQGFTRVSASFSGSASHGARVSNYSIEVRRVDGGANSQLINDSSGTTTNPVALNGLYEAIGTVTDSRGRTAISRSTFTVQAYSPPKISIFTASRNSFYATTVNTSRAGSHSPLGGLNPLSIYIQRKIGDRAWENVATPWISTSSTFMDNYNSTGNSIGSSYEFRLIISDTFGNDDSEIVGISTQRVVFDVHKNDGVGIGKIRERGVLDIDGEVYVRGILTAQIDDTGSALRVQSDLPNGHGYVGYFNSDEVRKAYVGFGATNNNHFTIENEHPDGEVRFVTGTGQIRVGWDYIAERGDNNNGSWIRLYDGTQICYGEDVRLTNNNNTSLNARIVLPQHFYSGVYSIATSLVYTDSHYARGNLFHENKTSSRFDILWRISPNDNTTVGSSWVTRADWIAIGRWK